MRAGARIARGAQQRLLETALDEQAGQRLCERGLDPAHAPSPQRFWLRANDPAEVRDAVVAEQLRPAVAGSGCSSSLDRGEGGLIERRDARLLIDDRVGHAAVPANAEVDLRAQAGLIQRIVGRPFGGDVADEPVRKAEVNAAVERAQVVALDAPER